MIMVIGMSLACFFVFIVQYSLRGVVPKQIRILLAGRSFSLFLFDIYRGRDHGLSRVLVLCIILVQYGLALVNYSLVFLPC